MLALKIIALGVLVLTVGVVIHELGSNRKANKTSGPDIFDINPTVGKPAIEAQGAMNVYFSDLGSQVEIRINAHGMPILYVDVNKDGAVDANGADLSYAGFPDGSTCIQRLRLNSEGKLDQSAACGNIANSATAHVRRSQDSWDVTWIIPKQELSPKGDNAHIAFQIFNENEQRGDYYPDAPFSKIYRLRFSPTGAVSPPIRASSPSPVPSTTPVGEQRAIDERLAEDKNPSVRFDPPVITTFQAEKDSIERGSTTVLRWSVTGATNVKIGPNLGILPAQGERTLSPTETTQYTLIAQGHAGQVTTRQLTLRVTSSPPSISSFLAEPASINKGSSTLLRWSVAGAATVRIEPGLGESQVQGERPVSPEQTTLYTLTAEGPGGRTSKQLTINVAVPPSPSINFDAEPSSLIQGQSTTLRWKVSGASRISIEPDIGTATTSGSRSVKPSHTTIYTLVAEGPGGSMTRELTVPVSAPGRTSGQIIWTGNVSGVQLVTIDKDHADVGELQGALPGLPCIIQPSNEKKVSVASTPGPRNNYERLVLRVTGNGPTKVVIKWSLQ